MAARTSIIIFAVFLMLISSLFRWLSGPFYFGSNSDPSYFYFFNFLCILEGKTIQFVDHPGTTLDILGALIVRIFFAPPAHVPWLMADAPRTEDILGWVWFSMVLFYAFTFVILGVYVYRHSKDRIFTGLVLSSSLWMVNIPSFGGQGVLPISANVNSDTMMMTAVNLMLLAMMRFYFCSNPRSLLLSLSFGVAVAFALATKFTALPFLFVAIFVLGTWPQRLLCVITALTGFVLLTCPIWGAYPHMITWVKGLIVDRGLHGSGGEGFDRSAYLGNLSEIFRMYWFFAAEWVFAAVLVSAQKSRISLKTGRMLLGVAIGGMIQVLIVAKQLSAHYMAPMVGLSSLVLALIYQVFPEWWQKGLKFLVIAVMTASLGGVAMSAYQLHESTRRSSLMLKKIDTEYPSCTVCPFYRSSLPGFGFVFWNRMLKDDGYSAVLKKYYPDLVYYDIFGSDFKDSAQQIVPFSTLRQGSPCVMLYGSDEDPSSFEPYLKVKKVYSNGGPEALYEVLAARSKAGIEYLKLAMFMDSKGDDADALKAALVSQQLGVGQDLSGVIGLLKQKLQPHD